MMSLRAGTGGRAAERGFNLIQLIFTIAILGILMALAVPNFTTMLQNSRRTSVVNELTGAMQIARGEAMKRALLVVVCPLDPAHQTCPAGLAADSTSCRCSANANDWKEGWITFVDNPTTASTANIEGDATAANSDVILGKSVSDYPGVDITSTQVTYGFRPFNQSMTAGYISVCDARGASYGRALVVDVKGRPRIAAPDGSGNFTDATGSSVALTCP